MRMPSLMAPSVVWRRGYVWRGFCWSSMLCPEGPSLQHRLPSLCWGLGGCACILGVARGDCWVCALLAGFAALRRCFFTSRCGASVSLRLLASARLMVHLLASARHTVHLLASARLTVFCSHCGGCSRWHALHTRRCSGVAFAHLPIGAIWTMRRERRRQRTQASAVSSSIARWAARVARRACSAS